MQRINDLYDHLHGEMALVDESLKDLLSGPKAATEADCSAEEAVYQAAIGASITAWAAVSAAQQVANACDEAASIACQALIECQNQ